MKRHLSIFLLIIFMQVQHGRAQPTAGTTGLLNTPTAEMQPDGTFMAGGTYLPVAMMPERMNFNTGNYYLNLTFLPFFEVSYRCTLLKMKDGGYHNQDRSVAVRGRLLKERRFLPSLVAGGNDVYTSGSGKGNGYFKTLYAVTSKNLTAGKIRIRTSLGYGFEGNDSNQLNGLFGGLSLSPAFLQPVEVMAEYDSNAFNAGMAVTFFNHLRVVVFAYDMEHWTGGLMYKIYL